MSSDTINAAVIELSGRYPESGWVLNMKCTSLVHVIGGTGIVSGEKEVTPLTEGDQLLIAPGEKYSFDGNMKLLYVAAPSWTARQSRNVA